MLEWIDPWKEWTMRFLECTVRYDVVSLFNMYCTVAIFCERNDE
jgi:hypothetical protein